MRVGNVFGTHLRSSSAENSILRCPFRAENERAFDSEQEMGRSERRLQMDLG